MLWVLVVEQFFEETSFAEICKVIEFTPSQFFINFIM